jgi:hypothetical protein
MGFAGPLKRLRRGDGIRRPAEMIVVWRRDLPAPWNDCGALMRFAGPLKRLWRGCPAENKMWLLYSLRTSTIHKLGRSKINAQTTINRGARRIRR